jgi:hypothetical protein
VFKQGYAAAAESQKVPLEIFFNPTILSDDNLFSEFSNFLHFPLLKGGCLPAGRQVETIDLDES